MNKNIPLYLLEKYTLNEIKPSQIDSMIERIKEKYLIDIQMQNIYDKNSDYFRNVDLNNEIKEIKAKYQRRLFEEKYFKSKHNLSNAFKFKLAFTSTFIIILSILIIFIAVNNWFINNNFDDSHILLRGEPHLIIFQKLNNSTQLLTENSKVKEGDIIQIAFKNYNMPYGMIFSIDGNGLVTLHYPSTKNDTILLDGNEEQLLNFAYQFDNAPYFEKFYFITSYIPFDLKKVLEKVSLFASDLYNVKNNRLSLPTQFHQYSITFLKDK